MAHLRDVMNGHLSTLSSVVLHLMVGGHSTIERLLGVWCQVCACLGMWVCGYAPYN